MNRRISKQVLSFKKGDYVKVTWFDASDARGSLNDHKKPECLVDEWGVFLGVGGSPEHILLGKHYVRNDHAWEATRIPLSLIHAVELIAKEAASPVFLRKYVIQLNRERIVRVKNNEW